MGYFEGDDERNYRKLYIPAGAGAVIFILGLILLIFGRGYGSDGTNYDLFLVFGTFLLVIGCFVGVLPLIFQLKIIFKGVKRNDSGILGYIPSQSAAGQMMRTTQVFSPPPSTYDGPQGMLAQQPKYNQPHQFSSAAVPYGAGSMEGVIESQGSLKQPLPNAQSYASADRRNEYAGGGQNFIPRQPYQQRQYAAHSSEI